MGANIMLAVHCKKAEPLELKGPVQEYIAATYGDSAAQDAAEDLETIQGQRAQIVGMGGSLPSLRDLMAKCATASETPSPLCSASPGRPTISLGDSIASLQHQQQRLAAAVRGFMPAAACRGWPSRRTEA